MRTLLALVLTVTAGMTASVAGLAAVREVVPWVELRDSNDVCGSYLQTLGTIYAVLLAFVVFVVWTQANDARRLVERQADELADVLRVSRAFGESVGAAALAAAQNYARAVADEEWPLLAAGRSCPRAAALFDDLWRAVAAADPKTAREESLFAEAVDRFAELGDARADLLHASRVKLPILLWLLLLSGAAGNIGSMYIFGVERFGPHATMTAFLAGGIAFMLFLIADLDNPFHGDWRIRPDSIVQVVEQAAADGDRKPVDPECS
jgi:hypothetical protein